MKNISILGSTGSIGTSTLDVIEKNHSRFNVVALSAGGNLQLLKSQIEKYKPKVVSVVDEVHAIRLKEMLESPGTDILWGIDGYSEAASLKDIDMVVSAIVGAAGLLPTIAAIDAGKHIALANKETMVMAGSIVVEKALTQGIKIIPVDSEHSAIFQCLAGHNRADIKKIILTASGGPFFKLNREQLTKVTPNDALKHPNWKMGKKITVDSASMMNKGLEVIEAQWLFGVDVDRIEIVIHPQSIVHSMVEYIDGSVIAQLGVPDMRGPISYALSYPERIENIHPGLDLYKAGKLEFFAPDFDMFLSLSLAYRAAKAGGSMPAVLNASNEVAVEAFISEEIGFTSIAQVVEKVLAMNETEEIECVKDVLEADRRGRSQAKEIIKKIREGD
jgi:1-deoxy-D-xylulose-5-phosphate reductoisomerase